MDLFSCALHVLSDLNKSFESTSTLKGTLKPRTELYVHAICITSLKASLAANTSLAAIDERGEQIDESSTE